MAQLGLLPKFLLVSLLFVLPLGLVSGLLFNELQKSIAATELEREGLRTVTEAQQIHILLQQHQALRFMERSGNGKIQAQIKQLQTSITGKLQAFGADDSMTMQDIVIFIKKVVDIMRNITSASQQQSTGIAEVGAEMANIDAMTQRCLG